MKDPNAQEPRAESRPVQLDPETMATVVASIPEAMREPTLWLAQQVRDRFSGSVTEAARTFKRWLGANSGDLDSRLIKLLNGTYWPTDGTDVTQRVRNQLEMIRRIQDRARLEGIQSAVEFVATDVWSCVRDHIDLRRAPGSVCRWGVMVGATGAQKTACLRHYALTHPPGSVIYFEAPEKASPYLLTEKLARLAGIQERSHDARVCALESGGRLTGSTAIVIDNAQDLVNEKAGRSQPCWSLLRGVSETTGAAVILSFTPEEAEWLTNGFSSGYFEQFEGRAGGRDRFLYLPEYPSAADTLRFARAFGLEEARRARITPEDVRAMEDEAVKNGLKYKPGQDWLAELISYGRRPGRVRILCDKLQDAKRRANYASRPFTMDYLQAPK